MLPLLCATVLAHRSIEFVIPVHYVRPSRIAALLQGPEKQPPLLSGAEIGYDDAAWTLRVRGTADEVLQARSFVKLVDVARPVVHLKLHVDSPAERFGYDISASLQSGQKWRLSEEATGSTIALEPRIGTDGSCTLLCRMMAEGSEVTTTLRLHKGQSTKVVMGDRLVREVRVDDGQAKQRFSGVPLPTLTVSYQIDKPKPYSRPK